MSVLHAILIAFGVLMVFSLALVGSLLAISSFHDKKREKQETHNAPYHESGHVVLAMVTGMGFDKVTVAGNSHNFGYMSHQKVQYARTRNGSTELISSLSQREILENSLLTSLAGDVAEMVTCGKESLPSHQLKHSDMEVVYDIITGNPFLYKELSLSPDEYLQNLIAKTRSILVEETQIHLLISETLATAQTLTEREVWELLHRNELGLHLHNPYGLDGLSVASVTA